MDFICKENIKNAFCAETIKREKGELSTFCCTFARDLKNKETVRPAGRRFREVLPGRL
jgi:hypothetical protein